MSNLVTPNTDNKAVTLYQLKTSLNARDRKIEDVNNKLTGKVNMPVDSSGNVQNGQIGQVLKSNGDGTTEWVM